MEKETKDQLQAEIKQFLRNEEKLWDMAAITSAATLKVAYHLKDDEAAEQAYLLADALVAERRRRFEEGRYEEIP